jgi:hypothetical protein
MQVAYCESRGEEPADQSNRIRQAADGGVGMASVDIFPSLIHVK